MWLADSQEIRCHQIAHAETGVRSGEEVELSAQLTQPDVQGPLLSFSCVVTHLDTGVNLAENTETGPECSSGTPGSQMRTVLERLLWVYVFCLRFYLLFPSTWVSIES